MPWNLSGFAGDRGPWALLILIGGILLIGGLAWAPVEAGLSAAGAEDVPSGGGSIFSGFLLVATGVALYVWYKSR